MIWMAINDFWWLFLSLLWYWGYYCYFYLWASVSLELLANNRKLTRPYSWVDKRISTRLCARLPANYCTMRYAPELYLYSYCESRYNCGAYLVVQLINFVYRVSIGMHKATWLTCNVHASLARCTLFWAC